MEAALRAGAGNLSAAARLERAAMPGAVLVRRTPENVRAQNSSGQGSRCFVGHGDELGLVGRLALTRLDAVPRSPAVGWTGRFRIGVSDLHESDIFRSKNIVYGRRMICA
ncbi:hypothetical protein [Azohydromonas lata]|uniref:Uncharacterized protein n=1 Tax=Azohydromonas lata TaxID=45677 RepID=A0ABU5IS16_9BURK|nr:hypothetical protein [Azohydromonas lata]MDZ5461696.1 hypothetical protein [Azohydromonas lata]